MTDAIFCPAAALADEARRLIDADTNIHEQPAAEQDLMQTAVHDFLRAVEDRATFTRAASARGALFPLVVVSDLIEGALSFAEAGQSLPGAVKRIDRILYSIADFIDRAAGGIPEGAFCGDYFMARRLNPFTDEDTALGHVKQESR
jgi:hypothetical protein